MFIATKRYLVYLVMLAAALAISAPVLADVTGRPHDLSLDNPRGHCINCHDLHQTGLGAGFAHNLKRANEIAVCYQCHAGAMNDYTSIDQSFKNWTVLMSGYDIRSEFEQPHVHFPRYGMDGEHNKCSQCHNPHGVFDSTSTTRLPKLLSAGPDVVTDTDEFCFVCHNEDPNPPHIPFSNISVGSQYRFSRTLYKQMTHSTFHRATTVTEPVPDTARTYDDNPYAAGRDISCLTCHRPHGSPNEHMLKATDDQDFCLACHNGSKAPTMGMFTTSGHGKAGVDRICQECHFPHGTGQENAVKTAITDPHDGNENPTDVSGSGMNEVCFACHNVATTGVYNNAFPANVSGWYSSGVTTTWDAAQGKSAAGSLKQVVATAGDRFSYTNYIAVQPNSRYTCSAWLYLPQTLSGTGSRLRVTEYNSSNSLMADRSTTSEKTTFGTWKKKSLSFVTGPNTVNVKLLLNTDSVGTAYWDDLVFEQAPYSSYYYTGKADYVAGVHNTSPNAHNPTDTGGDKAPGECGNCHNVHGTAANYSNMLVDGPVQGVCYDCHNSVTPNTAGGEDVQAEFAMSSNHDLAKVSCAKCHNVHKATQSQVMMDPYNPGDVMTDMKVFCLNCHSGAAPAGVTGPPDIGGVWTGGGHDTTHVLECADCHETHGSQNAPLINYRSRSYSGYTARFAPGNGFASREFCEACHNRTGAGYKGAKMIPTGAGFVGRHDLSDSTPCSSCHTQPHNPRLADYTGAQSYYNTACLDCHTQGVGNPFPYPDTDFNTPANGADPKTQGSIHDITYNPAGGTVDCVKCHGDDHEADHTDSVRVVDPDPANPTAESLDITASSALCLQCHDSTPVSIGGQTPSDIKATFDTAGHGTPEAGVICSECHEYHGSTNEKLLRNTINGSSVMGMYSGNNNTVCIACHYGKDANLPQWPGFRVYSGSVHAYGNLTTGNLVTDGEHGSGVCTNCHDPHGNVVDGRVTNSMLHKNEENLCYRCHASGFDNFSTPGDYNNKWTRFGTGTLNIKKEGGALHLGLNSVPAGGLIDDWLESSGTYPDESGTVKIDIKIPQIAWTDGYNVIGMRIFDLKKPENYVQLHLATHINPQGWVCRYKDDGGYVSIPRFGDEATTYHTIRFVRDKAAGKMYAYMDNTLVRTCNFVSPTGYFKVKIFSFISSSADGTPETINAYLDKFSVSYTDDRLPYNTAGRDDVQQRFYMKSHHNISDADQLGPDGLPGTADDSKIECHNCHDPHTITEKLMAFRDVSGAVVPIEADQTFCIKCHDGSPPEGVMYPEEGVWDKSAYLESAHGNHLKREPAFGNYSNGVTYPCKVCHNPHGSDQAFLQRDSWDIDRDGIPDDIDGDGVLDSTSMVGFIGYSGDTRKVKLVSQPRAGFARISSTIPYQANGTVDVELCFNCHDGSPAPDVETDFGKLSHHDVTYADQVASGGSKIECYHCHDQHRAQYRNDSAMEYPTTNPDPPRQPMPGDAQFCLRCHDNTLPAGLSFGSKQLKNIKLSYNPAGNVDAFGYDVFNHYTGHYLLSDGTPLMCRVCHNQHGSNYPLLLRDDTEPGSPNHDPSQPIQNMRPVALRQADPFSGGDEEPLSTTPERCLACHSGATTYMGGPIVLPPPPDERGFTQPPVGKHPDLDAAVTADNEVNGHIYANTFAVITTPGSIKESCLGCHDSHNPNIQTVGGELSACYQCHNENTSLPDVQSEFNDNQTNPTRSKSIHPIRYSPTSGGPDFVECLKCHDQSKHMQGMVRLRKDPSAFDNYTSDANVWADPVAAGTVNQFCLECHDPSTTVESSFWRGGTEHIPPKLSADHVDGAHFANGSLLCTDCHEYHGSVNNGLRKNERGDEETFCLSCHSNPANSVNSLNVSARFSAGGASHDVTLAAQSSAGTKIECEDCHNPHVVTRANPVVLVDNKTAPAASDDAFCIGCHDSDGGPGVKFPGQAVGTGRQEMDASTGAWNRWNKEAYIGSSHDGQGVACIGCHDPHGSSNYSMIKESVGTATGVSVGFGLHSTARGKRKEELGVNKMCSGCHASAMGAYNGYASFTSLTFGRKKGLDKNCTYCHNPHGTTEQNLIRSDRPLYMNMTSASFGGVYNFKGFANSTTGAPYYSFCSSRGCHVSERSESKFGGFTLETSIPWYFDTFDMDLPVDTFTGDDPASSHHPIKEGVVECISCHTGHGTSNAPDLKAPYYRESNWPKLFHAGRGVYSNNHGGGCGSAEPYDGSDYFEKARSGQPDATRRNKVTTITPPSNGNDLCFMCHQSQDVIGTAADGMANTNTKFIGHEAVYGGAKVSRDISRDANGIGTDYHNFTCSACHFPHSSTKSKLLKQGCFSQADGDYPNSTYATVFLCHPYGKWNNFAATGWRNLTTSSKTDFKRPPNAVTDLSVSISADLDVTLDWLAVEDAPGQGADHYNVYRNTQLITQETKPYATRIFSGVTGAAGGSPMTWTDRTAQPDTTYYYAVVACDAQNNESFVSNSPTAAVGPDTTVPNAVADQVVEQKGGSYSVKLTWSDPGDNVNVTEYRVYRKAGLAPLSLPDITELNRIATVNDTGLTSTGDPDTVGYSHTDATTVLGGDYSYAVMAFDAAGNMSSLPTGTSFSVSVVDPAPAAVGDLAARPLDREMKSQLTWGVPANVDAIQGYHVYRKAGSGLGQAELVPAFRIMSSLASPNWVDSAVPSTGVEYHYAVTAIDDSSKKESRLGNDASVNIYSPPVMSSLVKTLDSGADLKWSQPANMTDFKGYNVYYRRDTGAWTKQNNPVNLLANGGFEAGLNSWNSSGLIMGLDGIQAYEGLYCAALSTSYVSTKYIGTAALIPVNPSAEYTFSGYVNIPQSLTGGNMYLRVQEYNSSNSYIGYVNSSPLTVTSGWQQISVTWTTNSNTAKVYLYVYDTAAGKMLVDNLWLTPTRKTSTSSPVDFTGLEPGDYQAGVTADYSSNGATAPYESVYSGGLPVTLTDTLGPAFTNATGFLTPASGFTEINLSWNAPSDANYSGYSPSGVDYYRVQATYDEGATWSTLIKSKLTNPSFEKISSGYVDDGAVDNFTDVSRTNTNAYAVTDALFGGVAAKIAWTGSGTDPAIYSNEPATAQSVANKPYSMSFWAKASEATTFTYLIQANGGLNSKIGSQTQSIGTEWQRFTTSGTFGGSETATSARAVIRPSASSTVQITIDGIRLESSTNALLANDGSYFRPAGYDTPGTPQTYVDTNTVSPGTSAKYRVQAVDQKGNFSGVVATGFISAKPTVITDLKVVSATTTSGNKLVFSAPRTRAGLAAYKIYAKEQATPLTGLPGATLIDTVTPRISHGFNIATNATASANYTNSTVNPPPHLNDESESTRWDGMSAKSDNWAALTFGTAVPIFKVQFVFYATWNYQPKDYEIQTNDGSGWVTRVTEANNAQQTVEHTFDEPVMASQVRIFITDTRGGVATYFPIINEFRVYGGDSYIHDIQNATLPAEVGKTYAYAVIAEDLSGLLSDFSGGPVTVNTVTDVDPPDKVGDLVLASEIGTTKVVLTWRTPLDNQGIGATGATQYKIYQLPTSTVGTPEPVTDGNVAGASLVAAQAYPSSQAGTFNNYTATWYDSLGVHYAVTSADAAGNWSVVSNSPFIWVGKDTIPPSPPYLTGAVPSASPPEVFVNFSSAVDNVAGAINGYKLYRAQAEIEPFLTDGCITENNVAQAVVAVPLVPYDASQVLDTGVTPGTRYFYAMRAWDDSGNMSNISNCMDVTVGTVAADTTPPVWGGPTPLAATDQVYPDIDLVWTKATDLDDASGTGVVDHYDIYRSLSSFTATTDPGVTKIGVLSGFRNSFVDDTGLPSTTYFYGLVAVDGSTNANRSALSNVASATVRPAPSPDNVPPTVPGSLAVATGVYPYLNLSWTPSTDVDDADNPQNLYYYKLYRADYPTDITDENKDNPAEVDYFTVAHDAANLTVTGIGGMSYNFRLEAFDLAGNPSGMSNQVTGHVDAAPCVDTAPPTAPSNLVAVVGPAPDIDLSWTASTDPDESCQGYIDHYRMYKADYDVDANADGILDVPVSSLPYILILAGGSTSFVDSTGSPNTEYWYVMTAVDTSGNESAPSLVVHIQSAADIMPPAAVTDLKASKVMVDPGPPAVYKVHLTWCKPSDNVGINHYEIYRAEKASILVDADIVPGNCIEPSFVNSGICLSHDDTDVLVGHVYSYAVIAVDGAGNRSTISRGRIAGDTYTTVP